MVTATFTAVTPITTSPTAIATTTVTSTSYEPGATTNPEELSSSIPFWGASQWAPNNIAELEETDEQFGESGESGDIAEAVALEVEEAYAVMHREENT